MTKLWILLIIATLASKLVAAADAVPAGPQRATHLAESLHARIETDESSAFLLSSPYLSSLRLKAKDLLSFFEKDVLSALPADTKAKAQSKITRVILTAKSNLLGDGIFDPADQSNETELVLRFRHDFLANENAKQLIAHEFFHAIHHLLHPGEAAWVREGLALLFEYMVLHYFNGVSVAQAMKNPSTPLIAVYDRGKIRPEQYGHDLMYFYYLWTHCGGDDLIWRIVRGEQGVYGPKSGEDGIERALKSHVASITASGPASNPARRRECASFDESAVNFEIARIHNKEKLSAGLSQDEAKIHYLRSTTLSGPLVGQSISEEGISALGPYTPVLMAQDFEPLPQSVGMVYRFWLQKVHPFSVLDEKPAISSTQTRHWVQLLIKKPGM